MNKFTPENIKKACDINYDLMIKISKEIDKIDEGKMETILVLLGMLIGSIIKTYNIDNMDEFLTHIKFMVKTSLDTLDIKHVVTKNGKIIGENGISKTQ